MTSLNVINKYRAWTKDLIKEDLVKHPYAICLEHWDGDFNLGTAIRNANAFGAKEVFYLGGKKKWDRRSAVGTHNYTDVKFLNDRDDLNNVRKTYPYLIGIDNIPGAIPVESYTFPSNCLLIFGEEGLGLTDETIAMCDLLIEITMCGSVRSLNAGTSTGIILHKINQQYAM